MKPLTTADLLLIAEAATNTPVDQLQHEVNLGLAEAALAAPFAGMVDAEFFPGDHQKIAVLGYRLARYHPFVDGNKRTAYVAMITFARENGYEWSYPSEDETYDTMISVAEGSMTEDELAAWVDARLVRPA